MNKDKLIETLTALQEDYPDKEITRKRFREETNLKDSTWEKHFGSFLEFKRASGLLPSREQNKVLLAVTKHSQVDQIREFQIQRAGWEGKFLKPSDSRFQTILCGSDMHDKLCDPFYRRLFVDTAKRAKPEKILLVGDLFDMYEFSRYGKDPRTVNILEAIHWVHKFLEDLREASPNSELVIVEGNHEARLLNHLADASPHIMPILNDLHGFTVPSLLGLEKFEVNYVARADLAVFTENNLKKEIGKNYYIAHEAFLFHHFPYAKQWGLPGVNGHHHSYKSDTLFSVLKGPYQWTQMGAGHLRVASYCAGEKWSNGFCLVHIDTHTKRTQTEYFDTTSEFTVIGGQWYAREDNEKLRFKKDS